MRKASRGLAGVVSQVADVLSRTITGRRHFPAKRAGQRQSVVRTLRPEIASTPRGAPVVAVGGGGSMVQHAADYQAGIEAALELLAQLRG